MLAAEPGLLRKLSEEFSNPELHIFRVADCWFLESIYLDSENRSDIYSTGEMLVDFLNHALWLYACRPESIKSQGYFSPDTEGVWVNQFFALGNAQAPTKLTVYSHDIPSKSDFDVFARNWKVKEALALLAAPSPNWFTLFKIYETVRDDEPDIPTTKHGEFLIKKWGGIDENDRFFDTANWHRHSVFGKRRGKLNKPPHHPMSISEGECFIRTILKSWLAFKREVQAPVIPD